VVGNISSLQRPFISPVHEVFDDFLGDSIDTKWNTQLGTDGACASAISVAVGGMLRLTTGAGAGVDYAANGVQFEGALNWQANQARLVFETKIKQSALTSIALFFGFTDQVAALEMP
jgi:hypothetical protein